MKIPASLQKDAASYGGEHKTERISASALIPVGGDNFYNMRGPEDLEMLKMSNPNIGFHEQTRRLFGVKEDTKAGLFEAGASQVRSPRSSILLGFSDGARVRDTKKKKKGIIIETNVGYSKKKRIPAHRVSDKNGNTWFAKESDLDLLG